MNQRMILRGGGSPLPYSQEQDLAHQRYLFSSTCDVEMPPIVCLCGSTRYKDEFMRANSNETMAGRIVLSVGFFLHTEKFLITADQKLGLDHLHMRKIDLADEILVINVDGYIGASTRREIWYARQIGKRIRWLEAVYSDDAGCVVRTSFEGFKRPLDGEDLMACIDSWFSSWGDWANASVEAAQ